MTDQIISTDPRGNAVGSVQFQRDAGHNNRITAVIDPAGGRVEYGYDANGDLVSVTDRAGTTTQLSYGEGGAPAHYLTGIRDGRDVQVLSAVYDAAGRLPQRISGQARGHEAQAVGVSALRHR